jgi:hypothetical protein
MTTHDTLLLIAKIYLGIGSAFSVWLIMISLIQLDRFDWQKLHKLDALGVLLFAIVGWPFLIAQRPKSVISARALMPFDFRSAAFLRETDRISKKPPYCSSTVKFVQHANGIKSAEYILKTDALTQVLAKPIKRFWVAQPNDAAIHQWLKSADLSDPTPVDVPWVWTNFPMLVDEMLSQGLGRVHCVACQKDFEAAELSATKDALPGGGATHKRYCPEGHVVLNYRYNRALGDSKCH